MFSELTKLFVVAIFLMVVSSITYININRHKMYDEWKIIWKEEIEAEKRKLAMLELNKNKDGLVKKTR